MSGTIAIDKTIILSFHEGSISVYAQIYRVYYPILFNYGRKITTDENLIEDCIQEIFTSFWVNRSKLKKVLELRAYLFVAFRNKLTKSLARKKQLQQNLQSGGISFGLEISADQIMINSEKIYEQRISLKNAIDKLTERQKEAIFFKFYENMSYEEIATILNITTKATYKLVGRAIEELRSTYRHQLDKVLLTLMPLAALLNLHM